MPDTRPLPSTAVRQQYEALPYPPVDPQDEHRRLLHSWLDHLPMMNHYCFAGRQGFASGFRVLVAGGGTGTSTIFLAEQLRHTDARIVHLDLSAASIDIARQRAAIRGLTNIEWLQASLLDLPTLGLPAFDYINCIGVLHHLPDPDAGLRALQSVLKAEGALALMVYGQIGRTGVYQMQALMRSALAGVNEAASIPEQLALTRQMLGTLPPTNWFRRCEDLWRQDMLTDADVYDVVLHAQDRAYTVEEVFAWLADTHGHTLHFSATGRGRSAYLPRLVVPPNQLPVFEHLDALPLRQQYAAAELLSGNIMMHVLYATGDAACARYGDVDMVPLFYNEPLTGAQLAAACRQARGQAVWLGHQHLGLTLVMPPGRFVADVFDHLDGQRSFGDIFACVRALPQHAALLAQEPAALCDAALFADFQGSYDALNAIERLLLRHRTVPGVVAPRS